MKRSLSLLLALILCLSAVTVVSLSAAAHENDVAQTGTAYDIAGEGAQVDLAPTGAVKKSGDWQYITEKYDGVTNVYLVAYNGTAKSLKIPAKIGGNTVVSVEFSGSYQKVNKNVTSMTIPKDAKYALNFSTEKFPNVSSFAVESGNKNFKAKSGVLYDRDNELLAYPPAKTATTFTVPEGSVGVWLNNQRYLKDIVIPQSAEYIYLFNMPKLEKINLPAKVQDLSIMDCPKLSSFSVSKKNNLFTFNGGILYERWWDGGYGILHYPQTKTTASFTVPNNVSYVKIKDNKYLKNLTLGKRVNEVNITSAPKLTTVTLTSDKMADRVSLTDCPALTSFKINSGNKAYFVSGGVLYSKNKKTLVHYPTGKKGTSFTVPACVTALSDHAFEDAKQLKSIKLHANIAKIGECAFAGCTALTGMKMPNKVTDIAYATFYGCKNLKSVNLPKKLKIVRFEAFANCSSLFSVDIPKSATAFDTGALGNKFNGYNHTPYKSFVVRGYKGTAAQTLAKNQKQKFVDITPTGVKLSAKTATVGVKKSTALTAILTPANNADILKWTSSNTKVATVTGGGKVTGVKKGTVTITVTTSNGKKATCKVTVK